VWTRNLPARPSTTALLEAELEEGVTLRAGDRTCTVPVAEAAAARGMAPVLPALCRVAVAPDGSVWAERWELRALTQHVDVLEADGTLRGTLSGCGAPLGFLRGGARAARRDRSGHRPGVARDLPRGWRELVATSPRRRTHSLSSKSKR
jgi:hypothetical protein